MSNEHPTVGEVEGPQPMHLPKNPPQKKDTLGPWSKQLVMEKYLQRLGRFGQPHVQEYLYDLKRRNWRPNTLRSYVTAWKSFFPYLKERGRTSLETITRADLRRFFEYDKE